jgi:hypothetical protein
LLENAVDALADEIVLLANQADFQAAGREILHHVVRVFAVAADVVNANDVLMREFLADIGFVHHGLAHVDVAEFFRQQQLHRKMTAAGLLDHFPDLACLPGHHAVDQLVAIDDLFSHYQYSSK